MNRFVDQIQQRKAILDSARFNEVFEFSSLLSDCRTAAMSGSDLDIYVVRSIAKFEIFTRSWVRQIVDNSKEFAKRSIPLVQNIKVDYQLLLEASHKLITFGDLVAHAIPFSRLEHVMNVFQTLCDIKLNDVIPEVVDPWIRQTSGVQQVIVKDYKQACTDIATLFSLRHKVCHEGASPIESVDVAGCLKSLSDFTNALSWYLSEILYGEILLTQTPMNIAAIEKYQFADARMQEVLEQLRQKCDGNDRQQKLLTVTQSAWKRFCNLQATFRHDPQGGGSIGPLLRASEAEQLTIERTNHLLRYVNSEEGML